MSSSRVPNSGIMGDDRLDDQRVQAVIAYHLTPLPEPVIYYLRALEAAYLNIQHERRMKSASEIGWVFPKEPQASPTSSPLREDGETI